MARVHGRSQAWEDLRAKLGSLRADIESPKALEAAIAARQAARPSWPTVAIAQARASLEARQRELAEKVASAPAIRAQAEADVKQRAARQSERIAALRNATPWPVGVFNRLFRVPRERRKLDAILAGALRAVERLDGEIAALRGAVARRAASLEQDADALVTKWGADLRTLEWIRASGEYAGATAELGTVELLAAGLSDHFVVLVDVFVEIDRYRQVGPRENRRKTAQLDVVVVGPTGLFILEVKRWSRRFAESGQAHNPFEQIRESSTVCWLYLKGELSDDSVRTKEVIVSDGALPEGPAGQYARVVRPGGICRHILYGGGRQALDAVQVERVVEALLPCVRR